MHVYENWRPCRKFEHQPTYITASQPFPIYYTIYRATSFQRTTDMLHPTTPTFLSTSTSPLTAIAPKNHPPQSSPKISPTDDTNARKILRNFPIQFPRRTTGMQHPHFRVYPTYTPARTVNFIINKLQLLVGTYYHTTTVNKHLPPQWRHLLMGTPLLRGFAEVEDGAPFPLPFPFPLTATFEALLSVSRASSRRCWSASLFSSSRMRCSMLLKFDFRAS